MIQFFRKIRQNLVMENKTGKYLKYALGEIILVVIGILIALQINNWNEERSLRGVETKMLKNIKNSLQSDIENQIKPNLDQLELDLKNIEDIKRFLAASTTYNDSMNVKFNSLMYSKNHDFEVTSYKALENVGIQIIQNSELKTSILKLYNTSYPNLNFNIANFMNNLMTFFRPNMRTLFVFLDDNRQKGYVPINYVDLRDNQDFRNNLVVCTENLQNIYNSTKALEEEVRALSKLIDKELERHD